MVDLYKTKFNRRNPHFYDYEKEAYSGQTANTQIMRKYSTTRRTGFCLFECVYLFIRSFCFALHKTIVLNSPFERASDGEASLFSSK